MIPDNYDPLHKDCYQCNECCLKDLAKDAEISHLKSEIARIGNDLMEMVEIKNRKIERIKNLEDALLPFLNPLKTSYGARIINESCYLKAQQVLKPEKDM